jgi:acyl-CoA hydrolase
MTRSEQGDGHGAAIEACVDALIAKLGNQLAVALPLGLGKPVELLDALYARASASAEISLRILTALSLERPQESNPLRGLLLNSVFDRLYANYTEPRYCTAVRNGKLPDNITVREFYFKPGSRLGNDYAQQNYVSSNYTHAARDVAAQGCNVVMQLLARHPDNPQQFSMSCNPDTSAELVELLRQQGQPFIVVGVVHDELPYMFGDAEVDGSRFDIILNTDAQQHGLFVMPRLAPVAPADYAIGLYASSLIADGGTLQLGIGAMSDAIVHTVQLRHSRNDDYQGLLKRFGVEAHWHQLIDQIGGRDSFKFGLYGATEMFVEGFWHLFNSGILKREVFDFWALQMLINRGECQPQAITADTLLAMAELGVRELRGKDFNILQYHGYFRDDCHYYEGFITAANGERFAANIANPEAQCGLAAHCLGQALRNGKVLHGGFFLGSEAFYSGLRLMPATQRAKLAMCGVEKINQLDFNPRLYKSQRGQARFINTGLNVSLQGAVASDTLANGQVVSGVGGQYNFVAMAHQLPGGRSILMIRASRRDGAKQVSNIVSDYGSCTIPRHLRDIVITEYGIADLRSRTDQEVIESLICIADSRFQADLLKQAKAAGKLSASYQIPAEFRQNLPVRVAADVAWAQSQGMMPSHPLGCDFTEAELAAARALTGLAGMGSWRRLVYLLTPAKESADSRAILHTLGLTDKLSLKLSVVKKLLIHYVNQLS